MAEIKGAKKTNRYPDEFKVMASVGQVQAVQDRWFGASFAKVHQQKSII